MFQRSNCLTPNEKLFSFIMVATIRRNNDVLFILDQHA